MKLLRVTLVLLPICLAFALAQPGTLEAGDPQLGSGEYVDAYEVPFAAGETWQLTLSSGEFDPYLLLIGPDGQTVLEVDDSEGHGLDVSVEFGAGLSGVHTVVVTSALPGESGSYLLSVTPKDSQQVNHPPIEAAPGFAGRFSGQGLTLTLAGTGTSYSGQLEFQGESFPVTAEAGDATLTGSFRSGDTDFPFAAVLTGEELALSSDGARYLLQRVAGATVPDAPSAPNPLAAGATAPPLITAPLTSTPPAPSIDDPGPGFATGFVRYRSGAPLAGVEIRIEGVNMAGNRISAYPVTDADGRYLSRVPDGLVSVNAYLTIDYHEQRYFIRLAPDHGAFDQEFDTSLAGIVRNFSLRFDGLRPGGDPTEASDYYGGHGSVEVGQPSCCVDAHTVTPGSGLRVELIPDGPLLDGTEGSPIVLGCDACVPEAPAYASNWNLPALEFREIPPGRYQARATLLDPSGAARPASIGSHNHRDGASSGAIVQELSESITVIFPPYNLYMGEPGIGAITFFVNE